MNQEKNPTFEEAMLRLEEIVRELENGKVPLEKSLQLFEEGVKLSHYCHEILQRVEAHAVKINENGVEKDFIDQDH